MITIYKNKKDIPQNKEYVELNDVFFNKNTVLLLDDKARIFPDAERKIRCSYFAKYLSVVRYFL